MPDPMLRSLRLLAECYHAFERVSDRHVRELGLTPAQFDIVATLGRTPGMSFRELGERTLITKGTLTGVVDRLAARGLVARVPSDADRRSILVRLTPAGERLFGRVFPAHVAHVARCFEGWTEADHARLQRELSALRAAFAPGRSHRASGSTGPRAMPAGRASRAAASRAPAAGGRPR